MGLAALPVIASGLLVQQTLAQRVTVAEAAWWIGGVAAFMLTLFGVGRWLVPHADPVLLPCVAMLNGVGLVLIYRLDLAGLPIGHRSVGPSLESDSAHQVLWTLIGLCVFVAVLWFVDDHRVLGRYGYTCGLAGLVLLVVPAVLPGSISEVNGGKNWIRVHGFSIQPAEFSKILLVVFVAAFLVHNRDLFSQAGRRVAGMTLPRARDLGPLIVVWAISTLVLMFEKGLGVSLLIFGTLLVMLYVGTGRASWLLIGLVLFAVGATASYYLFAHVRVRVEIWNDPFATYATTGYQISQALFGMATGGILGAGLGQGSPDDVPFAKTDFIASTIGEELGLVGLTAVLLIYLVIVIRGMRAALAVRDGFGKLLAGGLAFSIGWQVFVVVGGVTGLIPLTGLTAPFLSYGGSSVVANYALIALLLRVSDAAAEPAVPARPAAATPLDAAQTQQISRRSTPRIAFRRPARP
ncbi:FtsW/RodA/SpoVE family cell cycle protein [Skermania sp. ID1734]|nr:FtsW/RodA/SpoVE family cell cycle protein [Skermania sp. ID1734]